MGSDSYFLGSESYFLGSDSYFSRVVILFFPVVILIFSGSDWTPQDFELSGALAYGLEIVCEPGNIV